MAKLNNNKLWFTALFALCMTATAQEQRALEEVIVTAQLRAQSLQDVPVSVNAVTGDKLVEAGLNKIEDLQSYVPNLTMSETGISNNIYIRGIGSGINAGFEQSVGMYVDGVYYGRGQLARAPFLDLARVEVLRGPQNILYGKNSIAGALSLVTARPGQDFEGKVSGLIEPEHGEQVIDLILSGPLTDTLGARLAIRHREIDGYIENLTLDRDEPQREEQTARLVLDWLINSRLNAIVKLEIGKFDVLGRQVEVVTDQPSTSSNPLFAGRRYSEILHDTQVPPLLNIQNDDSVLNTTQDYKRSSNGDFSNNDTYNLTVNVDQDRNGHTLSFITGIMGYEFTEVADVDFTGAPVFDGLLEQDYRQLSQELRWVSPAGERFEYITGAYLHYSELDHFDAVRIDSTILPELLNLADLAAQGGLGDRPVDGDIQGGCAATCDAGDHLRKLRTPRDFTTDTQMLSAFFQGTWQLTPRLRGSLGLRASYEQKKGSRRISFTNDGSQPDPQELNTVMAKNLSVEVHDLEGERTERNLAPSVNLQYDWGDNVMLYASASQGFKAGGFDTRSNQSPADNDPAPHNADYGDTPDERFRGSFEFDEEQALAFEAGAKTTLLKGAAELNIAAFFTEYDDLQVSIFDGSIGFNVGNAGVAETMGIELDGRWALTDTLTLAGAIAWLDFQFTDFEDGKCYQNQPDPEGDGLCDFTGKTNQYVADYSGNVSLIYKRYLGSLALGGNVDVVFTDEYNPTQDLDPRMEQDGYYKLNARLALAAPDAGWELALIGKNLNDEAIITYANSMSLANSVFGSVGHYAFLERPRSVALQASYRW